MTTGEDNSALDRHDRAEDEGVEDEDVLSERSPSLDSATHPYRSMLDDTSFPRCHMTGTPAGNAETYTRSMLMLGNGLPIWDPIGNINRPEKHVKSGVSIGDVGVLDNEGDFVCYFNVFLPPTDEVQTMCPPDMNPFHPTPGPADMATDASHFPPGTTLLSKGFKSKQLSASPLHIDFEINAREGAILVLPHGASREDLISTTRLREYVQQHALSWYIYMNQQWPRHIFLPNGSLYLVTGCDKAPSWAIATSHHHAYRGSEYPLSVKFRGDDSPVWNTDFGIRCRSSKDLDESKKYSVFIRGMKIAVSIPDWTSHILQNEPPIKVPFYNLLAIPITGLNARYQSFIEKRKNFPDEYLSRVTRFIFHPSDILLRFMLEESHGSVAILEDTSLSASYTAIGDGCAQEVGRFLVQVLSTHDIQNTDGLVMLVPKRPVPKEDVGSSRFHQSLFMILHLLKQWYLERRQRKDLIAKLRKIYPGSPVPPYDLAQGY